MKLGFVTAILPDLSLRRIMEFAAETGYECVEVMCWPVGKAERRYAGVTHIDVTKKLGRSGVREIQSLIRDTGVTISSLGYYPNMLSSNAAEARKGVDHFKKVIRASSELGIGTATGFVGRDWTKSVDDNWPRFLKTWKPIIALAEKEGVRIGIENCPMIFTNDEWPGGKNLATTPAIWRRMFKDIPSRHFGLNYDPSHMVWQRMDYLKPMRAFAKRLVHIHAKDVRVDKDRLDDVGIMATPLQYHDPKLPGLGDVNWGAFFSVLGEVGYTGPVCVEVEDRAFEGSLAARKRSLIQSHRYLRNFITPR